MKEKILGISAFYHDSAASLIVGNEIIAAAQEERFSRVKHDFRFPQNAVDFVLQEGGITSKDLDAVIFYEKSILKFERLLETYLSQAPRGLFSFLRAMPLWLGQKLHIPKEIERYLSLSEECEILHSGHHQSHAASAFYPSPFDDAAIVVFDGVGEWTTTSIWSGKGDNMELVKAINFPHSLGLLYSAFTYFLGFRVNSGEYKVMGLAPYGSPKYVDLILNHMIDLKDDGSFWLDQSFFNYCTGSTMASRKFEQLLGIPKRTSESKIEQVHMDLAASVQKVIEIAVLKIAEFARTQVNSENLCLSGGVALNCVANGRILRESSFENLWIQPASGDAGGSLGAALVASYDHFNNKRKRTADGKDSQKGSYLGPAFSDEYSIQALDKLGAKYERFENENTLCKTVAEYIAKGKIVANFNGKAEFGPRALGHRSILGDPRDKSMQRKINLAVKFRESFRPFAPSCLKEDVSDYFEMNRESPYMLLVAPIHEKIRLPEPTNTAAIGLEKINHTRSKLPAITHVDYSARVQTIDEKMSPRYHKIVTYFKKLTGFGAIINTSFNIRGEPIVHDPADAYRCFMFTDIDVLVVNNLILRKEDQPPMDGAAEYRSQFKLD